MKVLFTNPPTFEHSGSFNRPIRFPAYNYATPVMHPPLLLAYAAAYVRARGHDVYLIDAPVKAQTVEGFLAEIAGIAPDYVVAETSTPSFSNDVAVARMIKQTVPCQTVFVGSHVSALPIPCLEQSDLDAVIVGEYEVSLAEYIDKGPKNTASVAYREIDGNITVNERRAYIEDLDSLPFPARDLLPNNKYFDPILLNPFTFVLAGRGCPYRCTYCNWPQLLTGRRYRSRTPENIIDELAMIEQEYSFKSFLFNDDTFTVNRDHAMRVCQGIIDRGIKLDWGCYARADTTDRELLEKLREAGCFILKVGVESGNQTLLNNIRKGYKIAEVYKGIALMKELGFHVHATFVFGMPGETNETIKQTIAFAKELDTSTVQFSTAIPYPGTEFYQLLQDNDYLLEDSWDNFMPAHPIFAYPDLSARDLCLSVKKAYRSYYLRPKYVKEGIRGLFTEPKKYIAIARKLVKLVS